MDHKEIRSRVRDLVLKESSHLQKIKQHIMTPTGETFLSPVHENYIECTFVKYCLLALEDDIRKLVHSFTNPNKIRSFANDTFTTGKLESLPEEFKSCSHYKLILEEDNLLTEAADRKNVLQRIQRTVATVIKGMALTLSEETRNVGDYVQLHRELLTSVVSSFPSDNQDLWLQYKSKYPDIAEKYESAWKDNKKRLQEFEERCVQSTNSSFFNITFEPAAKALIEYMGQQVFLEQKAENGKHILLLKHPIILLSTYLEKIEMNLTQSSEIEEIHLIGAEVIYINCNLENSIWHGKNILLISKKIEYICPGLVWDLSGEHGASALQTRARDGGPSINGDDGANGSPGESGGYIMLIADIMSNFNYITVKSNGGDGGRGQCGGHGGNGRDGKNGAEMSLERLKRDFPSPAKFIGQDSSKSCQITIPNISKQVIADKKAWSIELDLDTGKLVREHAISGGCYLKGYTVDGLHIEFAFYANDGVSRQVYCIVTGQPGEPGELEGSGGGAGLGGEGGFPGQLTTYHLNGSEYKLISAIPVFEAINGIPGDNGDPGKSGSRGKPGRDGMDVGYVDYCSVVYTWFSTKYFVPGTYQLSVTAKTGSSVWCPYRKNWVTIRQLKKSTPKQLDHSMKKESCVQTKVAAQRKNAINVGHSLETYQKDVALSMAKLGLGNVEFEETLNDVLNSTLTYLAKATTDKVLKRSEGKEIIQLRKLPSNKSHNRKQKEKQAPQKFAEKVQSGLLFGRGSNKDESNLAKMRLNILSKIWKKEENVWINSGRTRTVHVKHPTSSKNSNSALHALFGGKNSLGYMECPGSGVRKEYCSKLKEHFPFKDGKCNEYLSESLLAYFEDYSATKDKTNADNLYKTLDKYAEEYANICGEGKAEFMAKVLHDEKCVTEYINFLGNGSIPFLVSDLRLIAYVSGIQVQMFRTSQGSPTCVSLDVAIDEYKWHEKTLDEHEVAPDEDEHESGGEKDKYLCKIAVDENHEFYRMVPIVERDMREVCQQMATIFDEVYSKSADELEEYFKQGKYGVVKVAKTEQEEMPIKMIQKISTTFETEEKFVETALMTWPKLMVSVYHDRLLMELSSNSTEELFPYFRLAFTKITELVLNETPLEEISPLLWTIATMPVANWTKSICLICVENYFEGVQHQDIEDWNRFLEPLPTKLVDLILKLVDTKAEFGKKEKFEFTKFLNSLQNFKLNPQMDYEKLAGIGKALWPYQLRILFISWKLSFLPNVRWDDNNKQSQALYYLHALYNENPKETEKLLDKLQRILCNRHGKCSNVTQILAYFYGGRFDFTSTGINSLFVRNFKHRSSNKRRRKTRSLTIQMKSFKTEQRTRTLSEIHEIIKNDSNSTVLTEDLEKLIELVKIVESSLVPTSGVDVWLANFRKERKNIELTQDSINLQMECVAVIDFVIKEKLGFNLRPTQKLAIVSTLWSISTGENLLSQVSTGEGKTLIVLAIAIVLSLFGQKVDIVTSSGVLAERDAMSNREIFSGFRLTVGEVASKITTEERQQEYLCDVVYGEVSHFQRDHLLDRFYNQNIRGARSFENATVIIDEVDSMFLDKGNSVLYLSHQPPDLDSLESIFVLIWTQVVSTINSGKFQPEAIHELVMSSIYPSISSADLLQFLNNNEVSDLWNWMISQKIINDNGRILISKGSINNIPIHFKQHKEKLEYIIQTKLEAPGRIPVMFQLKPFVEYHMLTWIHNAFQATLLREGQEYVVDVDRSKTVLDKNPKIMILDTDTGVDLKESQWNGGLHQFLQLKHGCRLSPMNLKAVFISNISFFKKYGRIFGLTGTIGTESDRQFLKDTYDVQILCMPLALPKMFIEEEPLIFQNESSWKQGICDEALEKIQNGRSALVICGTVQAAEVLQKHLKATTKYNIELYRRDYEKFRATGEGRCLEPCEIIIATNLAGRGTDIKLSDKLRKNGGLHVILSYLPNNLRVEQQAFGRAARSGDPGSGRLIFVDNISGEKKSSDAINLKIRRDELELARVADIETYYKTVIQREENMFLEFQKSFEKLTTSLEKAYKYVRDHIQTGKATGGEKTMQNFLDGNVNEMKELVMCSMLDDWAFWLDKFSTVMVSKQESTDENTKMMEKGLHKFEVDEGKVINNFNKITERYEQVCEIYDAPRNILQKLNRKKAYAKIESYILELIHEPALLIKAAKCFLNRNKIKRALQFLEKAMEHEDPTTIETTLIPSYYSIALKLKLKQNHTPEFRNLLEKVRLQLDNSIQRQCSFASIISEIQHIGFQRISQVDTYRRQKENLVKILGIYKDSIENLTGKESIVPQDFAICNEYVREHLCDYLVRKEVLLPACFKEVADDPKLKTIANQFGLEKSSLATILEKFSNMVFTPNVETELRKTLDLPSRSDFWKQIKECLENVNTFAVIQTNVQQQQPSSEASAETNSGSCGKNEFQDNWYIQGKPYISKYGVNLSENSEMQIIRCTKSEFQTQQKYIHLRKVGKLCYEQVAHVCIQKLEKLKLTKYYRIEKNSFTPINNIDFEKSSKLFTILQKHDIVDDQGILQSTEWTKDKLDFTGEFEVYRNDILAILHNKCRYKYELLSIFYQYQQCYRQESTSNDNQLQELKIELPVKPCNEFVKVAIEFGVISGITPNPNTEYLKKEKQIKKNSGSKISYLNMMDLRYLFPTESLIDLIDLYNELVAKRWITYNGEVVLRANKDQAFASLSQKYAHHQRYVLSLCHWCQELAKGDLIQNAIKDVQEWQGKLRTLSSPDINLIDIVSRFEGGPISKDDYFEDIQLLRLSGFDHILDTVEEAYTIRMICSALAVIALGLAQIALGMYVQFQFIGVGSFIGSNLVEEGINDVIYGLMAFKSGHFSWTDWVDNKWKSLVISLATNGISAVRAFAKGAKFSKYGEKLFGYMGRDMSGRVIKETLKKSAETGIKESVSKTLLKSFGNQVLKGCNVAASNMMVSQAYDTVLKKLEESLCEKIFALSDETIEGHKVRQYLAILVEKVGVERTQNILDRYSARVLQSSSREAESSQHFAAIGTIIWPVIQENIVKLGESISSADKVNIFMQLLNVRQIIIQGDKFYDTFKKIRKSFETDLDGVGREIQQEIAFLGEDEFYVTTTTKEEKENFLFNFKHRMIAETREKIAREMHVKVVEPMLRTGCQKLLKVLGKEIRGVYRDFKELGLRESMESITASEGSPQNEETHMKKQLAQICSKSRDPKVIAKAVELGGPLGPESLQALANKLKMKIVIHSDNHNLTNVFEPYVIGGEVDDKIETINLKLSKEGGSPYNLAHWKSMSANGQDNPGENSNCLLHAVNSELKIKYPKVKNVSREELAKFMREDKGFEKYVRNGWHHTYNAIGGLYSPKINKPENLEFWKEAIISGLEKCVSHYKAGLPKPSEYSSIGGGCCPRRGPIKDYSVEVKGKGLVNFQNGEVTPETLMHGNKSLQTNLDHRNSSTTEEGNASEDYERHSSSEFSPTTANYDCFAEIPAMNMSTKKAIEYAITKFVTSGQNQDKKPSVEYIGCFDGALPPFNSTPSPSSYNFCLKFKLDGMVIGHKVHQVPLPPPNPLRRTTARREFVE